MGQSVDTYYFLGIGGIGMSALARYFATKGFCVMGYDRVCSPLTQALEAEGIVVQYDDSRHRCMSSGKYVNGSVPQYSVQSWYPHS